MIHIHLWKGLTAGSRTSRVARWRPGLRVGDLARAPRHGGLLRNGRPCDPSEMVDDHDHLDQVVYPSGIELVPTLISFLVSAAVTVAVRAIMPEPERPKERGDERSPTYGYSSLRNIRAEGQPISVLYGEHLVAGTIFNEFVEVDNSTGESTYYALIGLGHGPVQEIAGRTTNTVDTAPLTSGDKTTPSTIYLNGNPLDNFHETKVWVRLGGNEQKLVPGFEKSKTTHEVLVGIVSPGIGVLNDQIPLAQYGSDAYESVWDEHGYAWDVPVSDVDGVEIVINFPGGLYNVDTTGSILPSRWVLGIRYCKLDGSGSPKLGAGFGGNQDDGWVRLPFEEFNLDRQNAFQLSFPVSFFDPLDFIDPVPGDAWNAATTWGIGGYLRTTTTIDRTRRPASWDPGFYATEAIAGALTFECWVAFDTSGGSGPFSFSGSDKWLCVYEWSHNGSADGVWFGFRITESGQWFPYMKVGKWGRFHQWPDVSGLIQQTTSSSDKKWHHLCWSHKRLSADVNTTRFWINGIYIGSFDQNIDIRVPDPAYAGSAFAIMKVGYSDRIIAADYSISGWIDEVVVHNDFFDNQDVQLRFNGGAGQLQSDSDPDLVVLWHIEGGLADSTGFANHGMSIGLGSVVAGGGKITQFVAPTRTRGRYRVQIVRINGEEGAGGERRQDTAEWQLALTWLDQALIYPGIAYTAVVVNATEQINGSAPTITQVVKGRQLRIWDRQSTVAPSFHRKFSKNPSWVALDVATDEDYGGGQAFEIANVDLQSFATFADHCDTRVYDGRGRRDFYRQDYETSANRCNSPTSIDAFWSLLLGGGPVVTLNTDEAPNGLYEADTLNDTDTGFVEGRGFTVSPSSEPSWYSASAFIKKDSTVTGHTCGIRVFNGSTQIDAAFNIDNGQAVANCVVEDYSDDYWLVKVTPFFFKGTGTVICYYLPAPFTRNTTTEDATLTGSMTVWGFSLHRGEAHSAYPNAQGPRAYIYMANLDSDGAAQTLPSHWVPGYELRIRSAGDTTWASPTTGTQAMEIVEVNVIDVADGYDRTWQIVAKWPDGQDAPDSTFPNLVVDGLDWEDIASNWTTFTGVTATAEFDDGGQTGGPDDEDPRFSTVCKVAGSTALSDPIEQVLPASVSGLKIVARAHIYKPFSADNTQLALQGSSGNVFEDPPALGWNRVEATLDSASASTTIGIAMAGSSGADFYLDGVGCWVAEDAQGNTPGGTIEGAEALFEYDGVHDTFKGLWDTLVDVLLTARAMPVREGNKLRVKFEAERPPVALVTHAAVVNEGGASTFRCRYVNEEQRPNSVVIDFHDQNRGWKRSTYSRDDPSVEGSSEEGLIRRENYFLQGVTRRSQVMRHAAFNLAVNRTLIREIFFTCDPTAVTFEPGDVIAIGHDLMPWGQGGRVYRSSGIGVNVCPVSENFDDWTSPTGQVAITTNSMSTPDGRPVADLIETLIETQAELSYTITDVTAGVPYCFSVRVKRLNGGAIGLALLQSGGSSVVAEYDYDTKVLTQLTGVTGIVLTVIEESDGWVRIGSSIDSANTNDITIKVLPERDPALLLGARVWLADAQVERGIEEPTDFDRPGKGIWLDRPVTLDPGEVYRCRVVSATTGATEECDISSGPGEYLRGDRIEFVSGTLSFSPQEGDLYLVYTDAQRMLAEVTAVRIGEDLRIEVDCVQYDDGIFDGDDIDANEYVETTAPGDTGSDIDDEFHSFQVPDGPYKTDILQMASVDVGGLPRAMLDVSWQHSPTDIRDLAETRVYVSFLEESSQTWTQPRMMAVSPGSAGGVQFTLPQAVQGRLCWVMVQPVTNQGSKRPPRQCHGQVVRISGRSPQPPAPTNFVAYMEGDRIVFTWDPQTDEEGIVYEIRHGGDSPRGGWVLGQKVGESSGSRLGPTSWWSTADSNSVYYYLRARNRHGVYSEAVTLQYGARILNSEALTSDNHWFSYVSQAWHNYADGWKTDSSPPAHDPVLTNISRHADGYLYLSSGTSGSYETCDVPSSESPTTFEREERLRIETHLIATCLDPTEVGESLINADGTTQRELATPEDQVGYQFGGNITPEGNLQGDLPTIVVQMRLIRDDRTAVGEKPKVTDQKDSEGDDGWITYSPGTYVCHGAQFRLLVTRPTTDWEVRIHEFHVRCFRDLPQRHYRSPMQSTLARELNLG